MRGSHHHQEEDDQVVDDMVTVSFRRPLKFYAATVYSKFKSNQILKVQGHQNSIAKAAELAESMVRKGDATIESLITSKNHHHPSIQIQLKRSDKFELS